MESMTFGEAISTCFSKYADFSGRATRSEYWYFYLLSVLVSFAGNIIPVIGTIGSGIFALVALIPMLAVTWRRLHDTGRSGLWHLLPVIFFALSTPLFFFAYFAVIGGEEEISIPFFIAAFVLLLAGIVFSIIILIWLCSDSQPGSNRFGPNPKAPAAFNSTSQTASSADFTATVYNDNSGEAHFETRSQEQETAAAAMTEEKAEELRKYKQLMDEGIITADDFEKKKNEILGL